MSRAVVLLGGCWSSSLHRAQIGPIVQNIVVAGGLGGITTIEKYREQKMAPVKSDFHLLQQIQQTQNKTAKQHRDMMQDLIVPFFEETNDAMIDYIKKNLFKVAKPQPTRPWGPIVAHDHDLIVEMMALPAHVFNGEHLVLPRTRSPRNVDAK